MSQHDFYFDPTFLKMAPGAKVTVTVDNKGSYKHNFSITSLNVNEDIEPGKSATVTFTLPSSGAVAFFCEYHKSSGMQGAFFFHAGDTVGTAPASSPTDTSTGYGTGY
jgi:plastocyanin